MDQQQQQLMSEVVHYITQTPQGQQREQVEKQIKEAYENDQRYKFLFPESPLYPIYLNMIQHAQQFQQQQKNLQVQQQTQQYQQPQNNNQQMHNMQQQMQNNQQNLQGNQFLQPQSIQQNTGNFQQQQQQYQPQQQIRQNSAQQQQFYQQNQPPQFQQQQKFQNLPQTPQQQQQQLPQYPPPPNQQNFGQQQQQYNNTNNNSNINQGYQQGSQQSQNSNNQQNQNNNSMEQEQQQQQQQQKKKKSRWSQAPQIADSQQQTQQKISDQNQLLEIKIQQQNLPQIPTSINNISQNNINNNKFNIAPNPISGQVQNNFQNNQNNQSLPFQFSHTSMQNPLLTLQNIQQINYQIQINKQQKQVQLPENLQFEEYSGGLMAEVIRSYQMQMALAKVPNVPYKPLQPELIRPHVLIQDKSKDIIKAKIDQLQEYLEKEQREEREKMEQIKKDKEREKEIAELAMAGIEVEKIPLPGKTRNRDIIKEVEELYQGSGSGSSQYFQNSQKQFLSREMGVSHDGSSIGKTGFAGLGSVAKPSSANPEGGDDTFANYRKARSYQYHVSAEERSSLREKLELCYKCNRPGHIAKDCKFGLT